MAFVVLQKASIILAREIGRVLTSLQTSAPIAANLTVCLPQHHHPAHQAIRYYPKVRLRGESIDLRSLDNNFAST